MDRQKVTMKGIRMHNEMKEACGTRTKLFSLVMDILRRVGKILKRKETEDFLATGLYEMEKMQ
jgi:hypothetical protein